MPVQKQAAASTKACQAKSTDEEAQPLLPKADEQAQAVPLRAYLAAFTAGWMLLGVLVGTQVEHWSFVTSLYVFVQIVTTIGYGDVTPDTELMKLFMAFYVLVSILLIAGFMSDVASSLIDKEESAFVKKLQHVENKVKGLKDGAPPQMHHRKVIKAAMLFFFFVLVGTVFYATMESCSCSFGATAIQGCVEGPTCAATGGATKTWLDSFYMSVITLTTVGFGDHSPKTVLGRAFGCIWMLLGVVSSANFVTAFGKAFLEAKKDQKLGKVSEQLFQEIDQDGSGQLSQVEFRMFALQKWGLVSKDQLDAVDSLFAHMDRTGDGYISFEELKVQCGS